MTDILGTIQKLIENGAKKDETIRKLEAKLQKYEEILLNRENPSEDMFLIYKNDFGEDSIDIIGRNIREFGELLYHQGYKLIARQESILEFCIYLASFDGNSDFDKSIRMIENLIEKKRKEEEDNVNNPWPLNRIVPEMKVNNDKLKEMKYETARVQRTLEEHKAQSDAKLNEIKNNFETTLEKIQFIARQTKKNEERRRLPEVNRFYAQRNLEYIRNSPEILEKMCMRLSVKNIGDNGRAEPPFKDIISMKEKKKELIGYFDLLQKNLDGSTEVTEIQKKIRDWMSSNSSQLLYKPTTSEKEECKIEMEPKLGVKNTIGTVYYMPLKYHGIDYYFIFCIANSKIICWSCSPSKQEALEDVYKDLVNLRKWDTNAKFATDMDVTDDSSDYFVHVSADEILKISNNHKVMEWVTNNFKFLEYNVVDFGRLFSIPAIYSLALKYFEESIE